MTRHRIFSQYFLSASLLLAFVVIGLGAFTRLVDAGLGCPDWPGCYGHLTWPETQLEIARAENLFPHAPVDLDKTWPEMVHRYCAGILGILVLLQFCIACHSKQQKSIFYSGVLLLVIIAQALFGMWTVTLKLWPQVVTAHLLGGFATLSMIWLLLLRHRRQRQSEEKSTKHYPISQHFLSTRILAGAALIIVLCQISLGGWTSANYAAVACLDFPTCHGEWLPSVDFGKGFDLAQSVGPSYLGGRLDSDARTAIHIAHRTGALVVVLITLLLSVRLFVEPAWQDSKAPIGMILALVVQVGLGITNVLAVIPLPVAVAHNLVAALLLLFMVSVNYQLYRISDLAVPTIRLKGRASDGELKYANS